MDVLNLPKFKKITAQINDLTNQVTNHKNIFISETDPSISEGEEGDIWFVVEHINAPYYTEGVENVAWVAGYTKGNISQSKQADHLYLETLANPTGEGEATYATDSLINVTSLSTIYIDAEVIDAHASFGVRFSLAISKTKGSSSANLVAYAEAEGNETRKIFTIDVSALSGSYYLRVAARDTSSAESRYGKLKVYKAWGES